MTIAKRFFAIVAFITGIFCTTTAYAHLQLTYTSDQLPFYAGYRDGEPTDDVGTRNPPFPLFSLTFTSTGELPRDGSTTLLLNKTASYIDHPESRWAPDFLPQIPASITLDSAGNILAWDFSFLFVYHGTDPEPPGELISSIKSSYSTGGDNIDRYEYKNDIFMEKPAGNWIFLTTVEVYYEGKSELNNWKIESLHIPEPNPLLLVLIGSGLLAASRLRITT